MKYFVHIIKRVAKRTFATVCLLICGASKVAEQGIYLLLSPLAGFFRRQAVCAASLLWSLRRATYHPFLTFPVALSIQVFGTFPDYPPSPPVALLLPSTTATQGGLTGIEPAPSRSQRAMQKPLHHKPHTELLVGVEPTTSSLPRIRSAN